MAEVTYDLDSVTSTLNVMTPKKHAQDNASDFVAEYIPKYAKGQAEHGGRMWEMGLKQTIRNRIDEDLDGWSYDKQIELCVQQIDDIAQKVPTGELTADAAIAKIIHVISREKAE